MYTKKHMKSVCQLRASIKLTNEFAMIMRIIMNIYRNNEYDYLVSIGHI